MPDVSGTPNDNALAPDRAIAPDSAVSPDSAVQRELDGLRLSIDNVDAALVHLLAERFRFTQQVGRLKAARGLPASDPGRERVQIARLQALAVDAHLDPAFAEKWFNFVVGEVIHHHEQIASTGTIETQ